MHIAIADKTQYSRRSIWMCMHYPFTVLKAEKLIAEVSSSNAASIKFLTRLGFVNEATVAGVYNDGDLHIFSIDREKSAKWFKE